MTNEIHDNAARIRDLFIAAGETVGPLSCSTNRNGDHSAYFFWRGADVRISDHISRTAATGLVNSVSPSATEADVAGIIQTSDRNRNLGAIATFAKAIVGAIKADQVATSLSAQAAAAEARKAAWGAHFATLGLKDATQTKINAAQKAWRKTNPIENFYS